jgi:hypothetical protein
MPSTDEVNAAFDAISPYMRTLVLQFIPSFFQSQALQVLASEAGRKDIVIGVERALIAAEGVRAKAHPPPA